jgi:four helix bundle protein
LEERIILFSAGVIQFVKTLPNNQVTFIYHDQIYRASLSVSLNYAEARGAESRKDFIHKVSICVKELRETQSGLKLIKEVEKLNDQRIEGLIKESDELISILVTSINTAKRNLSKHA